MYDPVVLLLRQGRRQQLNASSPRRRAHGRTRRRRRGSNRCSDRMTSILQVRNVMAMGFGECMLPLSLPPSLDRGQLAKKRKKKEGRGIQFQEQLRQLQQEQRNGRFDGGGRLADTKGRCDDDGRTESHFLDIAKGPFHQNYSYEGAGMSFCGV